MRTKGFTIVELAIATVLIGITLAIAFPRYYQAQARASVRSAADEFRLRHSMARSIAVRYGRVSELHIDATGGRLWVEVDTTEQRTGVKDTVSVMVNITGDFGVAMTSTRSKLCFDARGLATRFGGCPMANATVVFSRAGRADTVRTSVIGKVLR